MKFSNTRSLGFDTALHFWFRYVATLVSIRPSVYSTRRLLNPAPRLLNRRSLKYNGQMVYRQNMDKDKFRKGWLWGIYQPILTVCLVSIIVFLSGCGDKVSVPQPSDFELVSEPRLLQTIKNAQKAVVKNSKSAADWVRLGHVYLIHNWRDEASQCYRHAAELEPNEFRWFYYLGRSLEEIAPDEAAEALAQAIALNSQYPPAHIAYAHTLSDLGQFEKAEQYFKRAAELDAKNPLAELGLGELALKAKQLETAREHLQRALALNPQQKEAHSALAQVYMALGDKNAAFRHSQLATKFQKRKLLNDPLMGVVQMYGATAGWFAVRGGLFLQAGDLERAAKQFEAAVSGDQKDPKIWLAYGVTLLGLKRYQDAVDALERGLATTRIDEDRHEITPEDTLDIYINLSIAYEKVGDTKSSEKYLREALSFKPESVKENWPAVRGHLFLRAGDLEHAIEQFEATISADQKDPYVWVGYGTTLIALKRYQDAIDALEHALAATNDENYKYNITARKIEEIYINLGIAYGKIGNAKSAEQYLKKALTFNPSSPEAIYNLAVFYYSQGKLFEALEVLQSGRKIRNTKTLRMLADLLKELNMTNAAETVEAELEKLEFR